jgi:muconolactone delta-isomerase
MLHMVVMTHGLDTCAAVHPASGEKARNAVEKMAEVSKKHQVTVQGAWVDAPGHVFYILADAPNAHAVNNLMTELQFFHWNTVDIHPIVTLEEAIPLAK